MTTRLCSITLSAAIAAVIPLAPSSLAAPAGSVTVAQEARETLRDLKVAASSASTDADLLEFWSQNSTHGAEAQVGPLAELKQQVNSMSRLAAELEARRASLEPWEQQAVDKAIPLVHEAVANTEKAIVFFNDNRSFLWSADYRRYLEKVDRDSRAIAKTLNNYLKYQKVHEEEKQLETAIEAGGH